MAVATASAWDTFRSREAELVDLGQAAGLLGWDQQTIMPRRGAAIRANQLTTLQSIYHERLADPAFGEAIAALEEDGAELDEVGRASLRIARRLYDRAIKVPADLVRELARAEAEGFEIWQVARPARDFAMFQPVLEHILRLKQQEADAIGHDGERYDALHDQFEPGMRVARLEPLLRAFRDELVPFAEAVLERPRPDDSVLRREFPDAAQWDFTVRLLGDVGFDFEAGRQDRSAHPFSGGAGPTDVRVTTRLLPDPRSGIMATLHEAGHGMYEQGLAIDRLERTFAGETYSLSLHESQSRMWENMVGRSRPFWEHYFPLLRDQFPQALADVDVEQWWRLINLVERSLIRVEADEVTYNLHVLLRFELELALLRGDLAVADLPAAWNDAMIRYVGIAPPHDGDGVLQDVHWSGGAFGYFPTYTLGTLLSAQLYEAAVRDLGDQSDAFRRADFAPLLGWLRENVHRRASLLEAEDVVREVTGQGIDHTAHMRYLRTKFGEIYGV